MLVPITSIFHIEHGSKFDLNKMSTCAPDDQAIVLIGRTAEKNGLVAFVQRWENTEPFEAGLITVALGGSALSSFVQPRPFYTAQNIDVLRPLSEMSLDAKLYYCLCIEANGFRYSTFGREANITLKTLLVPDSVPNWVGGAIENSVQELCNELQTSVTQDIMAAKTKGSTKKHETPGPKAETLKIESDWRDAVKQSLQKKKPAAGWPK